MTSAQSPGLQVQARQSATSLRAELDRRRTARAPVPLPTAIEWIVPLTLEVAEIHAQGYGLILHPANLEQNDAGRFSLASDAVANPPATPQDRACLPPEAVPGEMGDEHASVYSLGAILYELVTGASVGPNMRRPSEIVPGLSRDFEVLLGNALISDPTHRPSDLNALAQALYQLAPSDSIAPPPPADRQSVSMLSLDVDVSLSMMPTPAHTAVAGIPASGPMPVVRNAGGGVALGVVDARQAPRGDTATAQLATLKAKLESDPSPRYVVIRKGMDHGPFNAVELLQQIGVNTFVEEDLLLDQRSGRQAAIGEWEDFSPFAEHAKRHRDIKAEKAAINQGVAQEKKQTRGKAFLGMGLVALLLALAGTWLFTQVGTRSDEVAIQEEAVSDIEAEGEIDSKKKRGPGAGSGKRVVGTSGGIPLLAGGMSCEGAQAAYVEEIKMSGQGQADITRGQYANIMNNGSYLNRCGVPSNVAVSICAAVQNGRAVGVTVTTTPSHSSKGCISSAVRGISFPSHPKLDVVRVSFAAQ
jgi:eukaryotic-like serine/threonine-protein kinase